MPNRVSVIAIHNDEDHAEALRQLDQLWSAKPGTREYEELGVLLTLVDAYEREHHAIEPPDPVDSLKLYMEEHKPPDVENSCERLPAAS